MKGLPSFTEMAPNHKNSDAGNSGMPKRSHKVLSLTNKVITIRYFEREGKTLFHLLLQYVIIIVLLLVIVKFYGAWFIN